jgi:uncharacterized repeat protein (TIGR03803 family)
MLKTLGWLGVVALFSSQAQGQGFKTLYSFQCGADGSHPHAGLFRASSGNLYGSTYYGGSGGKGVVFKVTASGVETVLHSFVGGTDGQYPSASLAQDTAGNLYGTTTSGGTSGNGAVFMLTPTGTEAILHSFTGVPDGSAPSAGLVADVAGNFYGTTVSGGAFGQGTVYKITPAGTESVLHSFAGPPTDGSAPSAALTIDSAGNLYGTTLNGGSSGLGMAFELSPSGVETVLHNFAGGQTDGAGPAASLLRDSSGNLYGTAYAAGMSSTGIAFKLSASGAETVLFAFDGHTQGRSPAAGMIEDAKGNLYGMTEFGGSGPCELSACGLVFELTGGKEKVLHNFEGAPTDGANPYRGSSLIADSSGNLYGTTANGGAGNCGTVFMLVE